MRILKRLQAGLKQVGTSPPLVRGLDTSLAEGLSIEQDRFVEVFRTADAATGVASFLEHGPGKAVFEGR